MELSSHLDPQCVAILDTIGSKDQLLRKIAELSRATGKLGALTEEEIYAGLEKREEQSSTAFGSGIAVPHCNFRGIENFVVGLIILKGKGIEFGSPDGKIVDLCFFIIGDTDSRNKHIQILSSITRLLNTTDAARKLRRAVWADDAFSILVGSTEFGQEALEKVPASLMTVSVQDEEIFPDILELFTAEPDCSLTIFEGESAGRYLHHLPLFSAFWTDEQSTSVRVIQGILKTSACNNMIRRINAIRDTSRPDAGILIGVMELSYWSGNLSY
jgi:nitrogen PTS system EIIA component